MLYNFDDTDGAYPSCPLIQGSDGNFYGTTFSGGSQTYGVIFKITATGKFTVLHNFNGATDGARPDAGLVQATGIELISPHRCNRKNRTQDLRRLRRYRRRWKIERLFAWLQNFRRLGSPLSATR